MARRKNKKASKFMSKIADTNVFGEEPALAEGLLQGSDLSVIMNWYNYMLDRKSSAKFIIAYFKDKKPEDLKEARKLIDCFSKTTGWVCRLITRGANLTDDTKNFIDKDFAKAKNTYEIRKARDEKIKKPEINNNIDKVLERKLNLVGDLEELIDKEPKLDVYVWLTSYNVPNTFKESFINYYQPQLQELEDAYNKKSADLVEAYSNLSRKELKDLYIKYKDICESIDRYFNNKSATRKVRVKKQPSVEKKLKNIEFKTGDDNLKIVSRPKESIFKSLVLWIYNTKYSSISRVVADHNGFDVKGKSILNIDPTKSGTKSIKRNTDEFIKTIIDGTKVSRNKAFDKLKGNPGEFKGRINTNMVLLEVSK